MIFDIGQLALGLVLLVAGGRTLVSSASALALELGVSTLVIGLTVVAFGTSAPELAVSIAAALGGTGEMAFGNIVGSNLANIGLVVGVSAIVRSLSIQGIIITREIPMMILASLAVCVLGLDRVGSVGPEAYDRADGLVLFLFFAVFLYYTIGDTLRQQETDPLIQQLEGRRIRSFESIATAAGLIAVGLVGLVAGGRLTVNGAIGVAETLAIPQSIIAFTVIAVGTSLPELTTSILAAMRGDSDLAIGNVVGSNIFNLLFVLPATAVIRPVPVPDSGALELVAAAVASALLLVVCSAYGGRQISHAGGWLLLTGYVGFVAARIV